MKNIFVLIFFASLNVYAQDFQYLNKIKLKSLSDFIENEGNVLKATDYLLSSPIDKSDYNRAMCNEFVYKYGKKAPHISVLIKGSLLTVSKGNLELMRLYIGLWLKSSIVNKGENENFHLEYVYKNLYEYCISNKGIERTEIIRSLIKAGDEDNIPAWISNLD